MLVSCIMPTANRRRFVPQAIRCFQAQDYAEKELVILDDGEDSVADLVPEHPQLRYIRSYRRQPVGTKRNAACAEARGEIIAHWDDDDWSAPWRLSYQVSQLLQNGSDVCGLDRVLFVEPKAARAWEYVYARGNQAWVYGATLCYRKAFWRGNPFPDISVGEDSRFVWNAHGARIRALHENGFFVGLVHEANTSPKQMRDSRWQPRTLDAVQALMGDAWPIYAGRPGPEPAATATSPDRPAALVSAAFGIGDILRVTPLIRVLDRLGYRVDVLLAPDYAGAIELLQGAPEIRRVLHYPDIRRNRGTQPLVELEGERYEVATFTTWSAPLAKWVNSKASHAFTQAEWQSAGDIACVEKIARALGWQGALPEPFAMASDRSFDLPPGTVALHPGCKPDWPWKKWHGFDGLARLLPSVAILGSDSDLDNSATYFKRRFEWPAHARNFVGQLGLADTAALIKQCAALVSNDSGLMHLGVALGVPTHGIFGITSPQREMIPSRFMFPVTKGLPCEPACRAKPWGRRDCEHHLECIKTLSPEEVAAKIQQQQRAAGQPAPSPRRNDSMETISLNYYGYVFDATGYGQAARGYIHALHAAGVKVAVVDMGSQPRQVQDDLVAALLGKDPNPDFHLFHGIPPQWAHKAYPLRNAIAMTVWETDTMPQRWRNPLNHAMDVWLPSNFNVEVFSRGLGRPAFRLPHAVPATGLNGAHYPATELARLGLRDGDFVFYSIFEWQDRKNPAGTIEAFLRAFPEEGEPLLFLKTNPGALAAAQRALGEARGTTGSRGRVLLCCEAWPESQLQALHGRGDCYLSLHKGEGWGYPLFEAACRGKPVVATGFSGPMDYLDPERHGLVRHRLVPVQQSYAYYHPTMRWAEPDVGDASVHMRQVYENRQRASERALQASEALRKAFSLEAVGKSAKGRLLALLKQANPAKWDSIERLEQGGRAPTVLPIPGDWYDADYFEQGLKSNWERGYTWPLFKGVFEDTAKYLEEMFPEAASFLDVGCAKGFLVKALRERGKEAFGCDHSAWAIEHAEPQLRQYLQLAGIDDLCIERTYDLLVAFSILESLTEAQIDAFLRRSREWTRQALIAFIPTLRDADGKGTPPSDRDLSRVTVCKRAWWHERFLNAGWRQDALHRIVESRCRTHPLAIRMGWDIYVYAP